MTVGERELERVYVRGFVRESCSGPKTVGARQDFNGF